jgi:5-methylthioribose kinase
MDERTTPAKQPQEPEPEFRTAVAHLLGTRPEALTFEPLTGGVSSDIWRVESAGRSYCAKRALPRLKVAARWEAPVSRNAEEVRWLRTVRKWAGSCVAEVIAADEASGIALLAWYDPAEWRPWKSELMAGRVDVRCATSLGDLLGTAARRAAERPELADEFANDGLFDALRIDPFFRHMRQRHAAIVPVIAALEGDRRTLVHGDFSPKNVLVNAAGEIRVLDAECATWGAPGFDAGYLLAHLLLKQVHTGHTTLIDAASAFWRAYTRLAACLFPDLDSRTLLTLAGVLLARVDGKSPVEYLTETERQEVRGIALDLLEHPPASVSGLLAAWLADWRGDASGSTVRQLEDDEGST